MYLRIFSVVARVGARCLTKAEDLLTNETLAIFMLLPRDLMR